MIRYIIIGCARSGTTFTAQLLRGHPEVSAFSDEVRITPLFNQGIDAFCFGNVTAQEKEVGARRLFDALAGMTANEHTKAMGMKITFQLPDMVEIFVDYLQKYYPGIKIIWVKRADLLAQYGSLKRAMKSGHHHSWIQTRKEINKIYISKNKLKKYLNDSFSIYKQFDRLRSTHEVFVFSYEHHIMNHYFSELWTFLGVTPEEPLWLHSQKVAPEADEYILNYKPLKRLYDSVVDHHQKKEKAFSLKDKAMFWTMNLIRGGKRKLKSCLKR